VIKGNSAARGNANTLASFFNVAAVPARLPPSIWLMQGLLKPAASACTSKVSP